ncbi:MAG: hypothetical protein ABIV43_02975 [Candidatus Saccharimonadales bacterium]
MATNEKRLRLCERSPGDNWRVIVELVGTNGPLPESSAIDLEHSLLQDPKTFAGQVALRGIACEAGDYLVDFRVGHSGDNFGALEAAMAAVDQIICTERLPATIGHAGMAPESEIRPDMPTDQAWQYTSDVTPEALDILDILRANIMDQAVNNAHLIIDAELAELLSGR